MLYVWSSLWEGQGLGTTQEEGRREQAPSLKTQGQSSLVWLPGRKEHPCHPLSSLPLLGFLLFNQHLRDGRGREASLCHHRSRCSQHSLHVGLGNCWPLEWPPPLASHPSVVSTHPTPPTSCAPKPSAPPSLTVPIGALGGTGWAPDTPSAGPGGNVWLCHLDDCGSAFAGEAWEWEGDQQPNPQDYPKRLCRQPGSCLKIHAFDPGVSSCTSSHSGRSYSTTLAARKERHCLAPETIIPMDTALESREN